MKTNSILADFKEGEKACARNIAQKLAYAKNELAEIQKLERSLELNRDAMLARAWNLGAILADLKDEIGHGKWLFWLAGNWPELGERNARRCMAFFKANEGWKQLKSAEFNRFEVESVRKFMWGYIPAKERLQLENDEPDKPEEHHLTWLNQFSKWDRQLRNGHIEGFSVETFRHEAAPALRRCREIGGPDWFASL